MRKIYIIEDDPALLEVLTLCFASAGFEVIADYNGNNFSTTALDDPDVYLVDINLINKSGLDIVKNLKANGISTPVILISANINLQKIAGDNAADDFIQKPFELYSMIQKVKELVNRIN